MIRAALLAALFAAPLAPAVAPAVAQDFSEGSEANEWGLLGEEKARFTAEVVDAVCALTGDCPEDCGAGTRQMVLLREADERMVLATKNGQPIFSGAAVDLAAYCGARVEVDGTLIGDPAVTPGLGEAKVYMVQRIRRLDEDGAGEWAPANRFSRQWEEAHPEAAGDGPWFRRDPAINAQIEANGYLGLGKEADAAFIAEWF